MSNDGLTRRQVLGLFGAASLTVTAAEVAGPGLANAAVPRRRAAGAAAVGRTALATTGTALTVPNAGFEQSAGDGTPADWTVTGTASDNIAQVSGTRVHSGARSLRLSHLTTAAGLYVRSAPIPVTAGNLHEAAAWVYTESGSPGWLYLEFWNAAESRIGVQIGEPPAAASWQQISVQGTAPSGTTHATVLVYGSRSVTGVSYWDDVTLIDLSPAYDPVLGDGWELFVDDYRIAGMANLGRIVRPGVKSGILLRPDKAWESNIVYLYGGMLWDEGAHLYRMWYTAIDSAKEVLICYAHSKDGVHWTKPALGLVDYQGSARNNIVLRTPSGSACYGVIDDPLAAGTSKRFKMLTYLAGRGGYCAFYSADGTTWTEYPSNPVIPGADVANVSYDPLQRRYIATTKQPYHGVRAAFVSTSTDFEHWTEPVLALAADDRDRALAVGAGGTDSQIYGMPAFAYGNAYLALPWIFELTGPGEPGSAGDGVVQPQIAASRDLVHWNRPDRDPLVPLGVAGTWDQGMVFTASTPVQRDDEVEIYYGAWNGSHGKLQRGASIGRMVWKRDRFVALTNGGDYEGTLTTKPVVIDGSSLWVNTKLAPGGRLRVELLDEEGAVLPGFDVGSAVPVHGDQLAARIRWRDQSSLAALRGRRVALRVYVLDGELYSLRIA